MSAGAAGRAGPLPASIYTWESLQESERNAVRRVIELRKTEVPLYLASEGILNRISFDSFVLWTTERILRYSEKELKRDIELDDVIGVELVRKSLVRWDSLVLRRKKEGEIVVGMAKKHWSDFFLALAEAEIDARVTSRIRAGMRSISLLSGSGNFTNVKPSPTLYAASRCRLINLRLGVRDLTIPSLIKRLMHLRRMWTPQGFEAASAEWLRFPLSPRVWKAHQHALTKDHQSAPLGVVLGKLEALWKSLEDEEMRYSKGLKKSEAEKLEQHIAAQAEKLAEVGLSRSFDDAKNKLMIAIESDFTQSVATLTTALESIEAAYLQQADQASTSKPRPPQENGWTVTIFATASLSPVSVELEPNSDQAIFTPEFASGPSFEELGRVSPYLSFPDLDKSKADTLHRAASRVASSLPISLTAVSPKFQPPARSVSPAESLVQDGIPTLEVVVQSMTELKHIVSPIQGIAPQVLDLRDSESQIKFETEFQLRVPDDEGQQATNGLPDSQLSSAQLELGRQLLSELGRANVTIALFARFFRHSAETSSDDEAKDMKRTDGQKNSLDICLGSSTIPLAALSQMPCVDLRFSPSEARWPGLPTDFTRAGHGAAFVMGAEKYSPAASAGSDQERAKLSEAVNETLSSRGAVALVVENAELLPPMSPETEPEPAYASRTEPKQQLPKLPQIAEEAKTPAVRSSPATDLAPTGSESESEPNASLSSSPIGKREIEAILADADSELDSDLGSDQEEAGLVVAKEQLAKALSRARSNSSGVNIMSEPQEQEQERQAQHEQQAQQEQQEQQAQQPHQTADSSDIDDESAYANAVATEIDNDDSDDDTATSAPTLLPLSTTGKSEQLQAPVVESKNSDNSAPPIEAAPAAPKPLTLPTTPSIAAAAENSSDSPAMTAPTSSSPQQISQQKAIPSTVSISEAVAEAASKVLIAGVRTRHRRGVLATNAPPSALVVTEVVYEHQRFMPLAGWREPYLKGDPHQFSRDPQGRELVSMSEIKLPNALWRWIDTEWAVEPITASTEGLQMRPVKGEAGDGESTGTPSASSDKSPKVPGSETPGSGKKPTSSKEEDQIWQYARSFGSTYHQGCGSTDLVRRRIWIRTRAYAGPHEPTCTCEFCMLVQISSASGTPQSLIDTANGLTTLMQVCMDYLSQQLLPTMLCVNLRDMPVNNPYEPDCVYPLTSQLFDVNQTVLWSTPAWLYSKTHASYPAASSSTASGSETSITAQPKWTGPKVAASVCRFLFPHPSKGRTLQLAEEVLERRKLQMASGGIPESDNEDSDTSEDNSDDIWDEDEDDIDIAETRFSTPAQAARYRSRREKRALMRLPQLQLLYRRELEEFNARLLQRLNENYLSFQKTPPPPSIELRAKRLNWLTIDKKLETIRCAQLFLKTRPEFSKASIRALSRHRPGASGFRGGQEPANPLEVLRAMEPKMKEVQARVVAEAYIYLLTHLPRLSPARAETSLRRMGLLKESSPEFVLKIGSSKSAAEGASLASILADDLDDEEEEGAEQQRTSLLIASRLLERFANEDNDAKRLERLNLIQKDESKKTESCEDEEIFPPYHPGNLTTLSAAQAIQALQLALATQHLASYDSTFHPYVDAKPSAWQSAFVPRLFPAASAHPSLFRSACARIDDPASKQTAESPAAVQAPTNMADTSVPSQLSRSQTGLRMPMGPQMGGATSGNAPTVPPFAPLFFQGSGILRKTNPDSQPSLSGFLEEWPRRLSWLRRALSLIMKIESTGCFPSLDTSTLRSVFLRAFTFISYHHLSLAFYAHGLTMYLPSHIPSYMRGVLQKIRQLQNAPLRAEPDGKVSASTNPPTPLSMISPTSSTTSSTRSLFSSIFRSDRDRNEAASNASVISSPLSSRAGAQATSNPGLPPYSSLTVEDMAALNKDDYTSGLEPTLRPTAAGPVPQGTPDSSTVLVPTPLGNFVSALTESQMQAIVTHFMQALQSTALFHLELYRKHADIFPLAPPTLNYNALAGAAAAVPQSVTTADFDTQKRSRSASQLIMSSARSKGVRATIFGSMQRALEGDEQAAESMDLREAAEYAKLRQAQIQEESDVFAQLITDSAHITDEEQIHDQLQKARANLWGKVTSSQTSTRSTVHAVQTYGQTEFTLDWPFHPFMDLAVHALRVQYNSMILQACRKDVTYLTQSHIYNLLHGVALTPEEHRRMLHEEQNRQKQPQSAKSAFRAFFSKEEADPVLARAQLPRYPLSPYYRELLLQQSANYPPLLYSSMSTSQSQQASDKDASAGGENLPLTSAQSRGLPAGLLIFASKVHNSPVTGASPSQVPNQLDNHFGAPIALSRAFQEALQARKRPIEDTDEYMRRGIVRGFVGLSRSPAVDALPSLDEVFGAAKTLIEKVAIPLLGHCPFALAELIAYVLTDAGLYSNYLFQLLASPLVCPPQFPPPAHICEFSFGDGLSPSGSRAKSQQNAPSSLREPFKELERELLNRQAKALGGIIDEAKVQAFESVLPSLSEEVAGALRDAMQALQAGGPVAAAIIAFARGSLDCPSFAPPPALSTIISAALAATTASSGSRYVQDFVQWASKCFVNGLTGLEQSLAFSRGEALGAAALHPRWAPRSGLSYLNALHHRHDSTKVMPSNSQQQANRPNMYQAVVIAEANAALTDMLDFKTAISRAEDRFNGIIQLATKCLILQQLPKLAASVAVSAVASKSILAKPTSVLARVANSLKAHYLVGSEEDRSDMCFPAYQDLALNWPWPDPPRDSFSSRSASGLALTPLEIAGSAASADQYSPAYAPLIPSVTQAGSNALISTGSAVRTAYLPQPDEYESLESALGATSRRTPQSGPFDGERRSSIDKSTTESNSPGAATGGAMADLLAYYAQMASASGPTSTSAGEAGSSPSVSSPPGAGDTPAKKKDKKAKKDKDSKKKSRFVYDLDSLTSLDDLTTSGLESNEVDAEDTQDTTTPFTTGREDEHPIANVASESAIVAEIPVSRPPQMVSRLSEVLSANASATPQQRQSAMTPSYEIFEKYPRPSQFQSYLWDTLLGIIPPSELRREQQAALLRAIIMKDATALREVIANIPLPPQLVAPTIADSRMTSQPTLQELRRVVVEGTHGPYAASHAAPGEKFEPGDDFDGLGPMVVDEYALETTTAMPRGRQAPLAGRLVANEPISLHFLSDIVAEHPWMGPSACQPISMHFIEHLLGPSSMPGKVMASLMASEVLPALTLTFAMFAFNPPSFPSYKPPPPISVPAQSLPVSNMPQPPRGLSVKLDKLCLGKHGSDMKASSLDLLSPALRALATDIMSTLDIASTLGFLGIPTCSADRLHSAVTLASAAAGTSSRTERLRQIRDDLDSRGPILGPVPPHPSTFRISSDTSKPCPLLQLEAAKTEGEEWLEAQELDPTLKSVELAPGTGVSALWWYAFDGWRAATRRAETAARTARRACLRSLQRALELISLAPWIAAVAAMLEVARKDAIAGAEEEDIVNDFLLQQNQRRKQSEAPLQLEDFLASGNNLDERSEEDETARLEAHKRSQEMRRVREQAREAAREALFIRLAALECTAGSLEWCALVQGVEVNLSAKLASLYAVYVQCNGVRTKPLFFGY